MYAREQYYIEIINSVRISSPRSLPFSLPQKCGILLKVTVDLLTFSPSFACRCPQNCVPT